jgi:DNA adenine methylase
MKEIQLDLYGHEPMANKQQIVNVASVPKRSPFRYPGGKTWLVPRIREWLNSLHSRPSIFLEPFAGGAIVSLTVGFERLADKVLLVELDESVGAVWQTIITDGDGPWLANRIMSFTLDHDSVAAELAQVSTDTRERAWKTILKNRVQRGGILAPGAGLIRLGENGKGLASRWYPRTLAQRITDIHLIRDRFTFIQGDGLQAMRDYQRDGNLVTFVDPPYTAGGSGKRAGTRLYAHNDIDHELLFALTQEMAGDVLMTYDNDAEVRSLAERYSFSCTGISMKNSHHATMTELLIGRDLRWAGNSGRVQP